MKRISKLYPVMLAVVLIFTSVAPSWAKEQVHIAMVLWRGMTEAENGFQTQLSESDKYDFRYTVFDANQDKKELKESNIFLTLRATDKKTNDTY